MSLYIFFIMVSFLASVAGAVCGIGGAVLGGIIGKMMFRYISGLTENKDWVGCVQAACLLVITLAAFLYTMKKDRIKTYHVSNMPVCSMIGIALGIISSFLGIGGGPMGRIVNRHIDNKTVGRLFMGVMAVIMLLCIYNMVRFM